MEKTIGLVFDSTCGYTKSEIEAMGSLFIPLGITLDNKFYRDGIDLTEDEFIEKLIAAKSFKTSAINPEELEKVFEEGLKKYDYLYYIPISNSVSSTNSIGIQVAKKEKFNNRVYVLNNSGYASPWLYINMKDIHDFVKKGKSITELDDILKKYNETIHGFLLPVSLKYLLKSGRVSILKVWIGNILKVSPIITYDDGKFQKNVKTVRGFDNALVKLFDNVKEKIEKSTKKLTPIFIAGKSSIIREKIIKLAKEKFNIEKSQMIWSHFPNSLITHSGPEYVFSFATDLEFFK